jgi:hypothetical protein
VKLYDVIMSVIYKCSVMRVLTFKVAAYVLLCDLLWSSLVLGSWCGSSGVRVGGGVTAGGVFSLSCQFTLPTFFHIC